MRLVSGPHEPPSCNLESEEYAKATNLLPLDVEKMNSEASHPEGRSRIRPRSAFAPLSARPVGAIRWNDLNLRRSGMASRSPHSFA